MHIITSDFICFLYREMSDSNPGLLPRVPCAFSVPTSASLKQLQGETNVSMHLNVLCVTQDWQIKLGNILYGCGARLRIRNNNEKRDPDTNKNVSDPLY